MDDRIWVICISYDYGVWDKAGYFFSEDDANKWIEADNAKNKIRHDEFIADWEANGIDGEDRPTDDDKEFSPAEFYAVELKQGTV